MSRLGPGTYPTNGDAAAGGALLVENVLRQIAPGKETAIDVARKLLDGKEAIAFTITQKDVNPEAPPTPIKAPSPRRAHVFYAIAGFIAYRQKYGTENTVVLADRPSHGAKIGCTFPMAQAIAATLDETSATGFEVVRFTPKVHPIFAPWLGLLERTNPVGIKEFVDFLAKNRRSITDPHARDLLLTLGQVRMSRSVELFQGDRNSTSLNGVLVRTKIDGAAEQTDHIDIPETITVTAPLYVGTPPVSIEIDLILGGDENTGVTVRTAAGDLLTKRSEMFDAMCEQVAKGLDGATVGLGSVATLDWDYLEHE